IIHRLGEEFSSALDKVFGNTGTFSKLLQGGQLGMATGSLLFGDNKGAQIGGMIGGSLGGMIGGSLGSLLGPIGNVVGSIIG
ncbi:hypothetical protein H6A60_13320, partial [Sutterella massiliensis]|nr:hypothetical protein [Sutterella massiliensis]